MKYRGVFIWHGVWSEIWTWDIPNGDPWIYEGEYVIPRPLE